MKGVLLSNLVPFLMGLMTSACLFMGSALYGPSLVALASHKPHSQCECCCGGECQCGVGECGCGVKCKCPPCKRCREFPDTGSLPK